jgi:hypothetical protein
MIELYKKLKRYAYDVAVPLQQYFWLRHVLAWGSCTRNENEKPDPVRRCWSRKGRKSFVSAAWEVGEYRAVPPADERRSTGGSTVSAVYVGIYVNSQECRKSIGSLRLPVSSPRSHERSWKESDYSGSPVKSHLKPEVSNRSEVNLLSLVESWVDLDKRTKVKILLQR